MKYVLSAEHGNRFKGLLILLVILGHMGAMSLEYLFLLYSFHVTSFLFLPFLFNKDKFTQKNIVKVFRRYYVPYVIFFAIAAIFYTIMIGNDFIVLEALKALIIGTSQVLKESIGLSLYWFFPTLVSLLLLIMIANTLTPKFKNIFLLLMVLAHMLLPILPIEMLQLSPFYLFASLYLFSLGVLVKYIYQERDWYQVPLGAYLFVLSLLLFIAYGSEYNLAKSIIPNIVDNPFDFILHDIIMLLGFFTILKLSEPFTFLETAGKYSIAIYTIHPFIIAAVNMALSTNSVAMIFIKFISIVSVTYIITLLFAKTPLYRLVYPR